MSLVLFNLNLRYFNLHSHSHFHSNEDLVVKFIHVYLLLINKSQKTYNELLRLCISNYHGKCKKFNPKTFLNGI